MKKLKIVLISLIVITAIVTVSGCIGESEIVVNNVAGVNNVKLNSSNFGEYTTTSGGVDNFHAPNGDLILRYFPSESKIRFSNMTSSADKLNSYLEPAQGFTNPEKKTFAGIKGYTYHNQSSNEITFMFVMNNKIYFITYESESEFGVVELLTAWLTASGFKQNWEYPTEQTNQLVQNEKVNITKDNSPPPHGAPGHDCDPGDPSCREAYNKEQGYPEGYDGQL